MKQYCGRFDWIICSTACDWRTKPFCIRPDNFHVAFSIQNFPALGTEISQHVCCSLPQVLAFVPICPLGCPDLPVQDNRPNFSLSIFQISSNMLPETVNNLSASHNFNGLPIWQSMGTNPSVVGFYPSCFPLHSHLFLFVHNIVVQHSLYLQSVCAGSICDRPWRALVSIARVAMYAVSPPRHDL